MLAGEKNDIEPQCSRYHKTRKSPRTKLSFCPPFCILALATAHSRLQSLVNDLVTWLSVVWLPGETPWNRLVGKYKLSLKEINVSVAQA